MRFKGCAEYCGDVKMKAHMHLDGPRSADVIAVMGLLDLYRLSLFSKDQGTASQRCERATKHLENLVGHERFWQFFAVHETEAWLLSQPKILPRPVLEKLPKPIRDGKKGPEAVNFDEPPAKLLDRIYTQATGKSYKKTVDGLNLFGKLDPNTAYQKCPNLQRLLDTMLTLAK